MTELHINGSVVKVEADADRTLLSVLRSFPGHFHNFVFLSVGVLVFGYLLED